MTSPTATKSPATPLSGAAIRHLRALGHDRAPIVTIGKDGLTDALTKATSAALLTHELIKVRVQSEAPVDRKEAAEALAAATGSVLAQVLGRTFLLYRRHPKTPKISFAKEKKAKPVAAKKPAAKELAVREASTDKRRDTTGDRDE